MFIYMRGSFLYLAMKHMCLITDCKDNAYPQGVVSLQRVHLLLPRERESESPNINEVSFLVKLECSDLRSHERAKTRLSLWVGVQYLKKS